MKLIALLLITLFDVLTTIFDIQKTEEGIKKGVAVEANAVVTALARTDKPSATFLYIWNGIWVAFALSAGFLIDNPAALGASVAYLLVDAIKHIIGGRQWVVLLKGGSIKSDRTAWQKFLGLGK